MQRRWLWLCLLALCALRAWAQDVRSFAELIGLFQYDHEAPLDIREEEHSQAAGAVVTSLSYLGGRGAVSAYLVAPAGTGKHPAIVFVHDLSSKRDEFLAEAISLAKLRRGAVSLLIDAPPARPAGWRRNFNPRIVNNDRDLQIQAIVDVRRGVDLLASRPDVDASRIAFVGHGQGANWGAVLMSVEPRLRAFVLIAGMISPTDAMRKDDPEWADMKYTLGKEGFERYLSSIAALDPGNYLSHTLGAPVLLQFGRFDPYIPADQAERLSAATRGRSIYYNSGHAVNDPAAAKDRQKFLHLM